MVYVNGMLLTGEKVMANDPNVQTSITLPLSVLKELREYRKESGVVMAHISRIAFREYLDKQKVVTEKSA